MRLPRPLYRENARQRAMLLRTLRRKKKGGTRHNTQKQPTNPPKACTRSLSTGRKMRSGTNREVCISHYAYHTFCYTSTGPLLLLFFCFLTTAMPTENENQPRYDTAHKPHTARTHTHTHTRQPHRTPPPHATHTNTKCHTTSTHTPRPRRSSPRAATTTTTGPQPGVAGNHAQGPRQEWRGTNRGTRRRTPARSGGAP